MRQFTPFLLVLAFLITSISCDFTDPASSVPVPSMIETRTLSTTVTENSLNGLGTPKANTPLLEGTPIPESIEDNRDIQGSAFGESSDINPLAILLTTDELKEIDRELFSSLYLDGHNLVNADTLYLMRTFGLRGLSGALKQKVYFPNNPGEMEILLESARRAMENHAADTETSILQWTDLLDETSMTATPTSEQLSEFNAILEEIALGHSEIPLADITNNPAIVSGIAYAEDLFGIKTVHLTFSSGPTVIELELSGSDAMATERGIEVLFEAAQAIDQKRQAALSVEVLDEIFRQWVECYVEGPPEVGGLPPEPESVSEFLPELDELMTILPSIVVGQLPNTSPQVDENQRVFELWDGESRLWVEVANLSGVEPEHMANDVFGGEGSEPGQYAIFDISSYWPDANPLIDNGTAWYDPRRSTYTSLFLQENFQVGMMIQAKADMSRDEAAMILGTVGMAIENRLRAAGIVGILPPSRDLLCSSTGELPVEVPIAESLDTNSWIATYKVVDPDAALRTSMEKIVETDNGDLVVAGTTGLVEWSSGNGTALWVIKLDKSGSKKWEKAYYPQSDVWLVNVTDLKVTHNDGLILMAQVGNEQENGYVWVLNMNQDGEVVWQYLYGTSDREYTYSIVPLSDEEYLIVGHTSSEPEHTSDGWVFKLGSNGEVLWSMTYGSDGADILEDVVEDSEKNYIAVGRTQALGSDTVEPWVLSIENDGDVMWEKSYGGAQYAEANAIQRFGESYIIAGKRSDNTNRALWLIEIDPLGQITWEKSYGSGGFDFLRSLTMLRDGGMVFGFGSGAWEASFGAMTLDSEGNIAAVTNYANELRHSTFDIVASADGGYGAVSSDDGALVMKMNNLGTVPDCALIVDGQMEAGNTISTVSDLVSSVRKVQLERRETVAEVIQLSTEVSFLCN